MTLLVQDWNKGWWMFPRGKINQDEDPVHCAAREMKEETSFDVSDSIDADKYIETTKGRKQRLFIIENVSTKQKFKPICRKEIRKCSWFQISLLNKNMKQWRANPSVKGTPQAMKLAYRLLPSLLRWIDEANATT
jgi:mRNA-decapping enzyme subunit 2